MAGTYFDEETNTYYVKGEWASSNEFFVCYWLEHYGHIDDYIFQYSILGGSDVRGGVKVDIVLQNTNKCPLPTPIEIDVEKWHPNKYDGESTFRRAVIEDYFNMPIISLNDEQTNSMENAQRTVRSELL